MTASVAVGAVTTAVARVVAPAIAAAVSTVESARDGDATGGPRATIGTPLDGVSDADFSSFSSFSSLRVVRVASVRLGFVDLLGPSRSSSPLLSTPGVVPLAPGSATTLSTGFVAASSPLTPSSTTAVLAAVFAAADFAAAALAFFGLDTRGVFAVAGRSTTSLPRRRPEPWPRRVVRAVRGRGVRGKQRIGDARDTDRRVGCHPAGTAGR